MRLRFAASGLVAVASVLVSAPVVSAVGFGLGPPSQDHVGPTFGPLVKLATAQGFTEAALAGRLAVLQTLSKQLSPSSKLSSSDDTALTNLVTSVQSGLQGLSDSVPSDTTVAQVQQAADQMVTSYHVYSFVQPVVRLVIAIDTTLSRGQALSAKETSVKTAVTAASQLRRVSPTVRTLETAFTRHVALVVSGLTGASAPVVALLPTATAASEALFTEALQAETRSQADLVLANEELAQIISLIAAEPSGHLRR